MLATVAAGLLMGNLGALREPKQNIIFPDGRAFVVAVWEFAAFIANSLVFLLIGLRVASIPFTGLGATALSVAVGLVLAGRVFTIYPLCLLFRCSAWTIQISSGTFGLPPRHRNFHRQHVERKPLPGVEALSWSSAASA